MNTIGWIIMSILLAAEIALVVPEISSMFEKKKRKRRRHVQNDRRNER